MKKVITQEIDNVMVHINIDNGEVRLPLDEAEKVLKCDLSALPCEEGTINYKDLVEWVDSRPLRINGGARYKLFSRITMIEGYAWYFVKIPTANGRYAFVLERQFGDKVCLYTPIYSFAAVIGTTAKTVFRAAKDLFPKVKFGVVDLFPVSMLPYMAYLVSDRDILEYNNMCKIAADIYRLYYAHYTPNTGDGGKTIDIVTGDIDEPKRIRTLELRSYVYVNMEDVASIIGVPCNETRAALPTIDKSVIEFPKIPIMVIVADGSAYAPAKQLHELWGEYDKHNVFEVIKEYVIGVMVQTRLKKK